MDGGGRGAKGGGVVLNFGLWQARNYYQILPNSRGGWEVTQQAGRSPSRPGGHQGGWVTLEAAGSHVAEGSRMRLTVKGG